MELREEVDIEDRIHMPIVRSSAAAILNALPALVRRAGTINDVLLRLVTTLRPFVPGLWRISVHRFLPGEGQLEFVAVWSASDTQLRPGTRVSAGASSMPEVLRLDRPVFSKDASADRTLLQQVLAAEGVASWVSIPLHRARKVVGLLTVSSIEPDAIGPPDLPFFERIGSAVEARLEQLAGGEP